MASAITVVGIGIPMSLGRLLTVRGGGSRDHRRTRTRRSCREEAKEGAHPDPSETEHGPRPPSAVAINGAHGRAAGSTDAESNDHTYQFSVVAGRGVGRGVITPNPFQCEVMAIIGVIEDVVFFSDQLNNWFYYIYP